MNTKYGLVLEGGALKGIFTAGVLDYFIEKNLKFPYICGVSMGACVAINTVTGQEGRARKTIMHDGNDSFYGKDAFIGTGSLLDLDKAFFEFPYKQYPFDFKKYFASDVENEIVVTNMLTGKAEYMSETEDERRLIEKIRASCSLPIITKPYEIDGVPYMDGGVAEPIPVKRAFLKGCKKCIVVLTKPEEHAIKNNSQLTSAASVIYKKYPEFVKTYAERARVKQSRMQLLHLLEKAGMIYVIRPTVQEISRLESDKSKLMNYYMNGYELAERKYEEILRFLGEDNVIFDE